MIYSNQEVCSTFEMTQGGIKHYILLGEEGRGRRQIRLACLQSTVIKKGMNPELTIGMVKGKTYVLSKQDRNLYMILSSEGGCTSRSDGIILVQVNDAGKVHVLTRGNGGDGIDVKVGNWDCLLLKVRNPAEKLLLQVRPAGMDQEFPQTVYIMENWEVYSYDVNMLKRVSELLAVSDAAEINTIKEGPLTFGKEWVKL